MRLGVLVGEDFSGKWSALALPDKAVQEQRAMLKSIKAAGGLLDNGKKATKFKRLIYFDAYTKRAHFDITRPAPLAPAVPAPAKPPEIQ